MDDNDPQIEVTRIAIDPNKLDKDPHQKFNITVKGTIKLCTDADLEKATAKKLRLLHREQAAGDATNSDVLMQIPFVHRYAVFDMQTFIINEESVSEEEILSKLVTGDMKCQQGTIHAYTSHQEYERFCYSARKKQRLRVDRVIDRDFHLGSCFEDKAWNEDTDFCVQSLDGDRVLSRWYFRVSSKAEWMNVLRCSC
jgi:hypothetical protein